MILTGIMKIILYLVQNMLDWLKKYKEEKILTSDIADAFIEKVLVDRNHDIEIIFKFQDEIDKIYERIAC